MSAHELVILAAGTASRFGRLKQVEPITPAGATLIEFAVFDAAIAGFDRLTLVVREESIDQFDRLLRPRIADLMEVRYAIQRVGTNPGGAPAPERTKPWGTGHAVLSARDVVRSAFCVINADDFYGRETMSHLHTLCDGVGRGRYGLVAYPLDVTVPAAGVVRRAECVLDRAGGAARLARINERSFERRSDGGLVCVCDGDARPVDGNMPVSMNAWAFPPGVFGVLADAFERWHVVADVADDEFYLPVGVQHAIDTGAATVDVVTAGSRWCGLTRQEDLERSLAYIASLVDAGEYPRERFG